MIDLSPYTFAFLDVETTGFSPRSGDRICEIAILRCLGKKRLESYRSLVNPMRPISSGARRVNRITDDDVNGAPRFSEIADRVEQLIEDAVIVCHNAPFDLGFLGSEFARIGKTLHAPQIIDTLVIARGWFRFPSNRLQAIASQLNIKNDGAHRAMADVKTTHAVFHYFIRELGRDRGTRLDDLMRMRVPKTGARVTKTFPATPSRVQRSTTAASERRRVLPPKKYWPVVSARHRAQVPAHIKQAVRVGAQLHITYVDGLGRSSQRVVTARELLLIADRVYLVAYCHLKEEERSFRLDRIVKIEAP